MNALWMSTVNGFDFTEITAAAEVQLARPLRIVLPSLNDDTTTHQCRSARGGATIRTMRPRR